jgi:sulfatase maturation enzyme AslB (radical SAM superfamily)
MYFVLLCYVVIYHACFSCPTNRRYEEFLSHLYKVWIKVDGEEEISEDHFKAVFHEVTGGTFSAPELDAHLSSLCEEGKEVMKSDGMLYRIH